MKGVLQLRERGARAEYGLVGRIRPAGLVFDTCDCSLCQKNDCVSACGAALGKEPWASCRVERYINNVECPTDGFMAPWLCPLMG